MIKTVSIYSILFCFLFSLVGWTLPASSEFEHLKFQYYTTNEGLAQNTVDCMLKDRRGFMWFGTWNGLCFFDGYSFTTFRAEARSCGLPNNFIYALCEDSDGNIWVGTRKSISRYMFDENRFGVPPLLEQTFSNCAITDLKFDQHNHLWVATERNGVWKVTLKPAVSVRKIDDALFPDKNIRCLAIRDNVLFAGTDSGLGVVNLDSEKAVAGFDDLKAQVQGGYVNCLVFDSGGNLWAGTNQGLFQQNRASGKVSGYRHDPTIAGSLNHLSVNSIVEDASHTMIIGTYSGLNFYLPGSDSFAHLPKGNMKNEGLNNPFVNSLFADPQGNVWIGTEKGGVNHYNIHQKPFYSFAHDPANSSSISSNPVNSVLAEDDVLWIGTAGGGLDRISANGQRVDRINLDPENSGIAANNFVTSVFRSHSGQLWLGTWGGGLKLLQSVKNERISTFQHHDSEPASLSSDFISSIIELNKRCLLIGTEEGLNIFDLRSNTFQPVDLKLDLEEPLEIGDLLLDSNDNLWIATRKGLFRIEAKYLRNFDNYAKIPLLQFMNNPADRLSLPGNYTIALLQTSDGTVWIGTYGQGICSVGSDENGNVRFTRYSEENGLCNNVTYALEEDDAGNIWISTDKGLSKFNPGAKTFRNFFVRDGLLSDQFYWSSSYADKGGVIYFGGIAGLNYFKASDISTDQETSIPVLTRFSIFNEPVEIGRKYHSRVILTHSIANTGSVELSYEDAVISIEFSALDYYLPEKIRYQYKMEGVDQDWVEVPASRRFANYTNLSGGEYLFQVRATNSDGVWSDRAASLQIIVHPPFWQTAWFRFLSVLAAALLVMTYIHYRTRFLNEQKRKLEKQVLDRTHKIEEQKEELEFQAMSLKKTNQQLAERQILIEGQKLELEKQNEQIASQRDEVIELNKKVNLINQLRLRFFTNISHEFRTPLTLILDPLEELMKHLKDDKRTMHTLKIIDRNAQRLLHLINQLIYFRRIESGKLNLRVSPGNLTGFLQHIFESFQDLADHQQIDYRFIYSTPPAETWFDSEKIENVLYNLLSNAFKYTLPGGKITLNVNFIEQESDDYFLVPYVRIQIIDSGKGIAKENMAFIFDRFYQEESTMRDADMSSSGIGLALTQEIVKALHGEIKVESELGKGSCFQVMLPYTNERFAPNEIRENAAPVEVNLEGRVDVLSEYIFARASGFEEEVHTDDRAKPLVLIVEDNFDLRNFLLQTLRNDYRTLGAENGKEGLHLSKKYSPELIISDVMMPVMDGIELCSRLKKDIQTSHIPIILLTAKNMVESWVEGLETGADDYIPKPFNLQILQAKMNNLIDSRRKLKRLFCEMQQTSPSEITSNSVDEEFMSRAYAVLEKNYTEPEFSASQFASEMFVSRSLLYKKIKAITDLNSTDFINSYKLKKAIDLIAESNKSIADIAFHVGFNDPKYFSRIFKKFYGMSPTEFQLKR